MEAAQEFREEGNTLFKASNYNEARDKYTEALRHDPSDAIIYSNRSAASTKLHDYELALSDALRCIEIKPQWSKGYLRKLLALKGLNKHKEVMETASTGFRYAGESVVKKELVAHWLKVNQSLNQLPEGFVDLPRGITILSQDYLQVIVHILRSLDGDHPLSLELTEQCLYSCAEQMEAVLTEFSEPVSPVIKEWAKYLPYEVYPYSIKPVAKAELEKQMKSHSEAFTSYLNKEVDPALYPVLRPILGLVVLVVLNRTNILSNCNTGHHSAELMNRAIIPLFESSILSTDEYYSLYIGRLCALLDSFIGRGYQLGGDEIAIIRAYYTQLQKVIKTYPVNLSEYQADKQKAEQILSNVVSNIFQPLPLSPAAIPSTSSMSTELAEQLVKVKPQEVKTYLLKQVQTLQSAKFLTMLQVEEILTMTGIFQELGMSGEALKVFKWGEQQFFQVFGHLLSSQTIKLDQCPATIAPLRQLVLSEASALKEQSLFADVVLRWKCLFKELRSHLIKRNSGRGFGNFFQWYMKQQTSPDTVSEGETVAALLKQKQEEEKLLQESAKPTLADMSQASYDTIKKHIPNRTVIVDYIFFAPLKECALLDGYCVMCLKDKFPVICELNYGAIHRQSAVLSKLLQLLPYNPNLQGKVKAELTFLSQVLFPQPLLDILTSGDIDYLYISPDSAISHIPFDSLPVQFGSDVVLLFERFSISILSSLRKLLTCSDTEAPRDSKCVLIGNPNYSLCKHNDKSFSVGTILNSVCEYFNISPAMPVVEQLVHSQDEVESVSHCLQSHGLATRLLVGDDATLSRVLSLHTSQLIHISSHAQCIVEHPQTAFRGNFFSDLNCAAIVLTGFNTFCRKNFRQLPTECGPALLPPLAIMSMKLQGTKLVFLSTCNSAAGTIVVQEAVDSLAEAFLTAGVQTVVATLWPIADQQGAIISKLFYKKLVTPGVRPSEALAYAKKNLKQQDHESVYWSNYAAFVCYGLDKPFVI